MASLRTDADRPTILLVDDRRENLLALEALLGELGHRLLSVQSGEAAVEIARDEDFALILLDVRMPGMSGLEAARIIKAMPNHRATPIIFVTANGVLPGNVSPYAAGGVDVLFKPLDIEALRAKVSTFAELWELRRREGRRLREEADRAAEETRRASAKREERRRALLAEASRVFAGSLELGTTLAGIAKLLVPDLADSVSIFLVEDKKLVHAATAHLHEGKERVVRALHERAALLERARPAHAHAIATGQRVVIGHLDEGRVRALADDEEAVAAVRELGPITLITVPLVTHGRPLGAITLSSRTTQRRYGEEEASVLTELAHHAASAIDNARLFRMAQEERQRADEANRTKDEFLAVVSHELRTPLNAILGWAKMLAKGGLDEPKTQRAVETIERNAKTQARLIEDLLDISRIMTGKLRLDVEKVDAEEPVAAAVEVVRPAAEAKGVTLKSAPRANVGPVVADPNRLQQAVWNLLANAVKFTPAGGEVSVQVERAGDDYVVSVTDTGAGIEPEFLPYVFDRFRQAEMGSARAHGGLGLGLSIVKHIAELHGGKVEAGSRGLGQGATFRLRLPLAPKVTPAVVGDVADARHVGAPESPASDGMRSPIAGLAILVVDDERDARDMLSSMLELCNASVVTASSAEEGVRAIQEKRPDVIISDVGMPIEDGYAFIHRVRSLPPERGGNTPAIALTAYANTADRTKALLAGFDMHLPKPIDPSELLAAVANVKRRDADAPPGQRAP